MLVTVVSLHGASNGVEGGLGRRIGFSRIVKEWNETFLLVGNGDATVSCSYC